MSDTPKWERQSSDTEKSWEAFRIYRDMGRQRSLQKAWEKYQNSNKTVAGYFAQWSTDHNWVERVQAWDAYQDGLRAERMEQRRIAIEERSLDWYERIAGGIEKYLTDYEAVEWRAIRPSDVSNLLSLMKEATDEGRRAVGLPHRVTENKTELTGKNGGAIEIEYTQKLNDDDYS